MLLPSSDRLLLGPGPSPVSPRVMQALTAPARSHLDPDMVALLDDIRARLARLSHAPDGSFALAASGTGTAGMEVVVANLAEPGGRAVVGVNGYFGERLATALGRCGVDVRRVEGEWGRALDPDAVRQAIASARPQLVAAVHGETSTGVLNPVAEIAAAARDHDALTIVDAVTSFGAVPMDLAAWQVDACYSCSQKGLGAPSGMAPVVLSPRALARRTGGATFYFDVTLLEDFWLRRKYHHTISAPLVYALWTALCEVEEEGLEARWRRHEAVHRAFVEGLEARGLSLLPPPGERLWNLNTVRVPDGVDEAAVRRRLLAEHSIEIGAGLGPLAGRIWRVGLMGHGARLENVDRLLGAMDEVLRRASSVQSG